MELYEAKLRAFCEGLEMQNIDKLMSDTPESFFELGKVMTSRVRNISRMKEFVLHKYLYNN